VNKKDKPNLFAQAVVVILIAVFVMLIGWTLVSRRSESRNQQSSGFAPGSAPGAGPSGAPGSMQSGAPSSGQPAAQAGGRSGGSGQNGAQAGGRGAPGAGQNAAAPGSGRSAQGAAQNGAQAGGRPSRITVRTQTVALGSLENTIVVNGDVQALRQVQIYPITGGKITQQPVRIGERVRQGQIIAVIDPSRPGEIYQTSPVRSTINGTLLQLPYNMGDQITASQAIAVVGDLSSLVVETFVPERFSQAMRTGLSAEISLDSLPNEVFQAKISETSPIINPASRTLHIKLVFVKPDPRIKSGMFATISLVTASRSNIPVLPREAVINTYGTWIVFVIDNTGNAPVARRREIATGMENETLIEVSSGLKSGEIVVISGQNFLSDGDAVRILE
jgi:multidrug efflux pump subunit AcrA (membrane-fusion protein)